MPIQLWRNAGCCFSPVRVHLEAVPRRPRYTAGGDGDGPPLGPPCIFPEHVPTPLAQTAGFSAIGGFGRGALGPLPAGYPAPASRFVLRDLRLLLQLCAPPDEPLAAPGALIGALGAVRMKKS